MSGCLVCGVDDSRGARRAVRVAVNLSEKLGLRLVVLHVAQLIRPIPVPLGGFLLAPTEGQEPESEEAGRLLQEVAEEYELDARVDLRLHTGDPVRRLLEVGDAQGAVMFVVGSRGRGPLASALLGSVSAELAAKAPCPVVVVPPGP